MSPKKKLPSYFDVIREALPKDNEAAQAALTSLEADFELAKADRKALTEEMLRHEKTKT